MGVRTRWLPFELHPDTPAEGTPKPFTDDQWPVIKQRLLAAGRAVGLPINPPRRNVNSRLALEIGELVREKAGDDASAAFHHAVARAFFVDGADISDIAFINACAAKFSITSGMVVEARNLRRYSSNVSNSMQSAFAAGVTGVPAFGWTGDRALCGMMEPEVIIRALAQ
jgi:predicted DsbA family dithiol-disulfide isomerase